MFELVADPGTVALVGTVVAAALMKKAERRLARKKMVSGDTNKAPKPHRMSNSQKKNSKTEFDCEVYSDRLFERKLVNEKVIEEHEMTVCEDISCPNCKFTRMAKNAEHKRERIERWEEMQESRRVEKNESEWEKFQYMKKRDPSLAGWTYADWKREQAANERLRRLNAARQNLAHKTTRIAPGGITAKEIEVDHRLDAVILNQCEDCGSLCETKVCPPCVSQRAQQRDAELIARNSQHMHGRWVEINGMRILRPAGVPAFANYQVGYNAAKSEDFILWSWSYDGGLMYYRTQKLASEPHEVRAGNEVLSSWVDIIDPESGDVLGSYKHHEDGRTSYRDTPARCKDEAAHQLTGECGCDFESAQRHFEEELLKSNQIAPLMIGKPKFDYTKGRYA